MSDTAPWEDFGGGSVVTTTTNADAPPWEDFKQSSLQGGVRLSNATLGQEVMQGFRRGQQLAAPIAAIPGHVGALASKGLYGLLNIPHYLTGAPEITPQNMLPIEGVQGLLNDANQGVQHAISGLRGDVVGTQAPVAPIQPDLSHFIARAIHEFGTPENAMLALSAAGLPANALKLMGVGLGAQAVSQAAQQFKQGDTEGGLLLGLVAAGMLGGAAVPKAAPTSGLRGSDITDVGYSRVPEERQLGQGPTPQPVDKQLPQFSETSQTGMTQPSSGEVTQLPQLTSKPQFITDPKGQVVDVSQLTPWEEAELMRGPREYSPPQQGPVPPPFANQKLLQAPGPITPQGRQLPQFAETGQTGMTQPSSGETTELRSNTGSQFVVDQKGRTIDVSQLTPWEEAKLKADITRGPEPQQGPVPPPYQSQKQLPPPSGGTMQAGPTTLKQTLSNVGQQLKGEEPQLPGQKYYSGIGIDPEKLRPAIRWAGRLFVGEQGDTHQELRARYNLPKELVHTRPELGFALEGSTKLEDFKTRKEAEAGTGIVGDASAGGLDSQQLPGAPMHRLERMMREQEAKPTNQQQRERAGRGETQYFSGVGGDLEDIKDVFTPKARLLLRSPEQLKFKTEGEVDAGRNPDGTPKTSITARMYSLDKTGPAPYSTTGTRLYNGIPLPELEKSWDSMKKWFKGPMADTKDWTPLRDPVIAAKELFDAKNTSPITSKVVGLTLPTEGPTTTLADRLIGTKNDFMKKVAAAQDLATKADKVISPMDVIWDMAEGGKATFDGPLFRNVRWPLDFDFNAELNLRKQKMDPVRELVKKGNLKEKNGLRLGIYAMVQQGARERLIENGVPATYIDNIVKTLTPAEKEVYVQARRQLDSMLPQVQQVAKDVLGMDVQPVKDYFPMQRDWRDVSKPPSELAKPRGGDLMSDAVDFLQADFTKRGTKTERGYTIERVPDAKTAVKLNFFDVYERHVKDVAHFVASQKRLNEIAKLVRDPKFAEKYGDVTQSLTMDWLNSYAKQGRSINALPQLDWVRKAVARGVLGFRVASQFVHLANVPLGMQRAGIVNYSRGLQLAMSEEGQVFLHKNLAETFERGGGELELLERQGPIEKAAFRPQRELDKWNSQATSLGIYLREGGTLDKVDQKALAKARVEARRAVASPLYKDLPPLLRTQSGKIVAQFQNTFMDQWSNIRYDLPQYLMNNPRQAMGLMVALSAMVMVESGIKQGAKKGLQAATGYEPKHGDEDTYWKKVGHEALRRIPGYGQISSMVEYGSTGVPVLDVVKQETKDVKDALTSEDEATRKLSTVKAATGAAELAGVTGAGQISEVVQDAMKAKLFKPHQKRLEEVAAKAGLDLSDFDSRLASEAYMKESRPPMTEAEKVKGAQAAIKGMSDRRQAVMNSLDKADKQWLKANQIEPPGFGDYLEEGKVRVPYTDKENKFATEMYKTEYETVISFLRNDAGFKQLNPNEQQLTANEAFRDAAKRAREQVTEVVKSGALVDKPKKRFSAFAPE